MPSQPNGVAGACGCVQAKQAHTVTIGKIKNNHIAIGSNSAGTKYMGTAIRAIKVKRPTSVAATASPGNAIGG